MAVLRSTERAVDYLMMRSSRSFRTFEISFGCLRAAELPSLKMAASLPSTLFRAKCIASPGTAPGIYGSARGKAFFTYATERWWSESLGPSLAIRTEHAPWSPIHWVVYGWHFVTVALAISRTVRFVLPTLSPRVWERA